MSAADVDADVDAVLSHLDANADVRLETLKKFLRIASVSADPEFLPQMTECAAFVHRQLTAAGLQTETVETDGHPIVYGEWLGAGDAPTVVIYGHYDVQPPDPLEDWTTPAFEPTVREGALYARGATDDKGQLFTHIASVAAWMQTAGHLPVNVKFVIEGEEEVGSDNLDRFLEDRKASLACDLAVISDTSQYGPGIPAITYGLRGIMACEVRVSGPGQDLHSGVFGGSVANPANGLARMVAALHDDEGRVQIPGFYDDVVGLSDDERDGFASLPFDESKYLANLGMSAAHGEAGFTTLERRWARPTCDVNGMQSGYTGAGPKTIVPSGAMAKITCRLVPQQDPVALTANLKTFLESHLLPGLELELIDQHGAPGVVMNRTSPFMDAAKRAIERAFGVEPVLIREGGSIPVVGTFKQILEVDTLLLGWGQNTDNLHSPNEHFSLRDFEQGTRASALLWHELATH